ncbi:MAG: hypothetical protein KAS30_01000 [Candidatus Diapherotrites archaeon]|nr:hypothetical protein [Candidatus Diapherotrites archaeon]
MGNSSIFFRAFALVVFLLFVIFLLNVQFSFSSQEESISKTVALEKAKLFLNDNNVSIEIESYTITPIEEGFDARFFMFSKDLVVLPDFVVTGKQVIVSKQGVVVEVNDFVSENEVVLISSVKGVLESLDYKNQKSIFSDRQVSFIGSFVSQSLFSDSSSEIPVSFSEDSNLTQSVDLNKVYQIFGQVTNSVFVIDKISPSIFPKPSAVQLERSFDFDKAMADSKDFFSKLNHFNEPTCIAVFRNVGVCPKADSNCVFVQEQFYEWVAVAEYVEYAEDAEDDSNSSRLNAVVFSINNIPKQTVNVSGSIC